MKNLILILLAISLYLPTLSAQNIEIKESTIQHNDKLRPSLSVNITPDTKEVKKKWKDFMDDKYDVKVKGIGFLTNKDVLTAEKVAVNKISNKQIDFYAKVVEDGDHTRMDIFAAPGYDIYIDPKNSPRAYAGMRSVLVEFLNYYLPEFYQEQVEDAQDNYEDWVETRNDLKDDISDNINEIEDLKKEIEDLKKENKGLNHDLVDAKSKLSKAEVQLKTKKEVKQKVKSSIESLEKSSQ